MLLPGSWFLLSYTEKYKLIKDWLVIQRIPHCLILITNRCCTLIIVQIFCWFDCCINAWQFRGTTKCEINNQLMTMLKSHGGRGFLRCLTIFAATVLHRNKVMVVGHFHVLPYETKKSVDQSVNDRGLWGFLRCLVIFIAKAPRGGYGAPIPLIPLNQMEPDVTSDI